MRALKHDCVHSAINLYWRALGSIQGMQRHQEKHFEYVISLEPQGPCRIYNIQFPNELESSLDSLIQRIQNREVPDSLLLTSETKPKILAETLKQKGFHLDDNGLCMVYHMEAPFLVKEKTCEVIKVECIEDLAQWATIINTALFECELLSLDQYKDLFQCENMRFYLAKKDGVAVSACFTVHDGCFGDLDMVATLASYRRQGIASHMIQQAMNDLYSEGIEWISLRAEVDGIALYKKIGFEEVCKRISAEYVGALR